MSQDTESQPNEPTVEEIKLQYRELLNSYVEQVKDSPEERAVLDDLVDLQMQYPWLESFCWRRK